MKQAWSGDQFLAILNKGTLPKPVKVKWVIRVDIVILTGCGNLEAYRTVVSPTRLFGKEGDLQEVVKRYNLRGGNTVVVFPECCSPYPDSYRELLKATVPGVSWVLPAMGTAVFTDGIDEKNTLAIMWAVEQFQEAGLIVPDET